ncbi:hypothetical protein SAMN05892883_3110 [Jatrophihabitans sp. GAS493]|uniref:hypothetical protein n=1 Tax=Jatrophihabitans sp. GAS493 TaxID=1907575 RepID=UPI000BC0C4DA|nr:hypothetical protein [Jatrophihabitans sp. GAS493]SOD73919.1 hypothetical protein SAMN05892883_3110 [Jatrophihabitans sp. GAS493]
MSAMSNAMSNLNRMTFHGDRSVGGGDAGPLVLTPVIDNVTLVDRVKGFEQGHGFTPAGGYGGLVPSYFQFGELRVYFMGKEERQWPRPEHLWLLACDCGEVGCWPLTARVVVLNDTVMWMDFAQDHRPGWDYSEFGPFVFARDQYERAVEWAANEAEGELDAHRARR